MASRALADSPGGGGGSRLGRLSPLGESEEVTDATDVEESSAFVAPDDDDDDTDGRMSAAIEKRLDARGSLATVVVRLGSYSESGLTGVEPGPRSSSALPPSAEPSGMSLARPRVGESPSPPPAFETICATVLAAVAAFWNFPVVRHFGRGGKNSINAHLFLFEALRLSPFCPPILKPDLKE